MCVCVYNLRFSLFSHSSLRSALKFKQSAINYTCWALSIFHFPLASTRFLFFLSTFFGPLKHLHTLGRRAEFQYVAGSLSQQHPLQCCVTHCVTHSVTPPVWQSVTVPVQRTGSVSVGQKCDHSAAPCQGVAELGFANNFESNFHKLACHTLQPPLLLLLFL